MIRIDEEKCIGCGQCEDVCTFGAIELVDEIARVDQDKCTLCGSCAENCPEEAIIIEKEGAEGIGDLDAWRGVWVVAEYRQDGFAPVTFELLGRGRGLADDLGVELSAVAIGKGAKALSDELIAAGADRVYVADAPELDRFSEDVWARILAHLAGQHRPEVILAGATAMGRAFVPQVATMLETGLTADCTQLDVRKEDRCLLQTRPAFGGNLLATIVCPNHRPQMATVRPHVLKAAEPDASRTGEVVDVELTPELLSSRVKVLESVVEEGSGPDLANAEVIVTAGRGMESQDNLKWVEELAGCLGGAVAGTRAVTDAGWLPHNHQIGQTGATVAPKLYIGCGVSGAIQHLVGMQGSEIIVAINRDPDAPIFEVSTYGIVGDVKEILPLLIKRVCSG